MQNAVATVVLMYVMVISFGHVLASYPGCFLHGKRLVMYINPSVARLHIKNITKL